MAFTPAMLATAARARTRARHVERAAVGRDDGVVTVERVRLAQLAIRGARLLHPVQLELTELCPRARVLGLRVDCFVVELQRLQLVPERFLERRLRQERRDRDGVPIVRLSRQRGIPAAYRLVELALRDVRRRERKDRRGADGECAKR